MSTAAVEPASPLNPPVGAAPSLVVGSLLGSVVILAGFVAGGYAAAAVPDTTPYLELARIAVYLGVVGMGVAVGGFLANTNPAHGVRGGIILTVSALIATAFVASGFYYGFADRTVGSVLAGVAVAAGGFAVFRILTSRQGIGWCQALDDQGWAGVTTHKRTQGLHVRRYAMLGILALGITGAYSLYNSDPFGGSKKAATAANTTADAQPVETARQDVSPPLLYRVPFAETSSPIPLVPVANLAVPVLLVLATVWVSWRAVNVPTFGDFLIATEAEMNKVSWSTRKKLLQDTIVVLVFLLLLTVFLFVIDLFWGWLLSLDFIRVLPSKPTAVDTTTGGRAIGW